MQRAFRGHVVAAAVGLTIGLGGAVWASIPDASGVIHACYKAQNGQLRIVDPSQGQTCVPSETPLQWNQAGPAGTPGAPGAPGAAGTAGPQGPAGPAGPM